MASRKPFEQKTINIKNSNGDDLTISKTRYYSDEHYKVKSINGNILNDNGKSFDELDNAIKSTETLKQ